jgi:hypothetical protein
MRGGQPCPRISSGAGQAAFRAIISAAIIYRLSLPETIAEDSVQLWDAIRRNSEVLHAPVA